MTLRRKKGFFDMPKSAPKQKPLGSKKKMPISILGLLGMALVLVGIVAAIGLMQINQDSRSNAGGCRPWENCRFDAQTMSEGNAEQKSEQAKRKAEYDKRVKIQNQQAKIKAAAEQRGINREAQSSFQDAAKMDAAAARRAGGTVAQQPTGTPATGGSSGGDNNNSKSGGSSSSVSIAPTNMRVECSSDKKTAKLRWDNKGKANTFSIGVDKINSCSSPVDGWMCAPGDFVKTISCTDSSCSYRFNVEKGRYGTVAITAIKGDQRIESKLTKGFSCR